MALHSILKQEGIEVPDNYHELRKLLTERLKINGFTLELLMKINNKRINGIQNILKYGEVGQRKTISLDDTEDGERSLHETIGDTDSAIEQSEFTMTLKSILEKEKDKIPEKQRKILEALARGEDVSDKDYMTIAELFHRYPEFLEMLG